MLQTPARVLQISLLRNFSATSCLTTYLCVRLSRRRYRRLSSIFPASSRHYLNTIPKLWSILVCQVQVVHPNGTTCRWKRVPAVRQGRVGGGPRSYVPQIFNFVMGTILLSILPGCADFGYHHSKHFNVNGSSINRRHYRLCRWYR